MTDVGHRMRGAGSSVVTALLMAATLALGIGGARAEILVEVPAGTHTVESIVTQAGTAAEWVRYRPATPGTVTLIGGGKIERSYVILDGFYVDASLDPDLTDPERTVKRAAGLWAAADNVRVENTEIVGINSVHNGYDTTDSTSCKEFDFGTNGTGFTSNARNVTLFNVTLHGFREATTIRSLGDLTMEQCLYRNNFNGVSHEGFSLVIRDSVIWDTPNHQFSIKTLESPSLFHLENTLLANSQDMIKAGANWEGVERLIVRHNTFWIPPGDPCGEYSGINSDRVTQEIVIRDNIFVNLRNGLLLSSDAQNGIIDSDYNLIYQHDPIISETPPDEAPDEFRWNSNKTSLESWRSRTCAAGRCQDQNSIARQQPLFNDPPDFVDPLPNPGNASNQWGWRIPSSVAEARSWLSLRSGSPGKGAASDGLDMGIVATSLPGNCGNGVIDDGELCDPGPPEQLGGNDCTSIGGGFTGGTLRCSPSCSNWDTSECTGGGGSTPPPTPQNLRRTDVKS